MNISFDTTLHLLGERCYEVDCTLAAAHGGVAYMEVGEGREHGAVSFATPWNRITIPRRCALCRDARVSQAQDVRERPLPCTPATAHSTPPNCGF